MEGRKENAVVIHIIVFRIRNKRLEVVVTTDESKEPAQTPSSILFNLEKIEKAAVVIKLPY